MLFGLDVRRRICSMNEQLMSYVDCKSSLDILNNNESNEEIKEKIKTMISLMDDVIEIKKNDLHTEIKSFEEDFIKDIKEHRAFYGIE